MGKHIGSFFFFVGLLVIFIFAVSMQVDQPNYAVCLIGLAALMLGAFLLYKFRRRSAEADRFRMIGKMRNRKKKDE